MKRGMTLAAIFMLAAAAPSATIWGQGTTTSTRAFTEGEVTSVTYVRTKPGMFNKYMEYLQATYKKQLEAEKAAGIVVRYAIYGSEPRDEEDHDVVLIVVYKNMAALDNLDERSEAVANRVMGNTPTQRDTQFADRSAMRTVLGSRLYRELILK